MSGRWRRAALLIAVMAGCADGKPPPRERAVPTPALAAPSPSTGAPASGVETDPSSAGDREAPAADDASGRRRRRGGIAGRPDPTGERGRGHASSAQVALAPMTRERLCVTRGGALEAVGERRFVVGAPTFRAVAPGSTGDVAELHFTYRGPTAETVALGSGQIRRQLGVKLRAADGCNLIYVMWRIDPKPGIEVSVKRNPGSHAHAACGNRGYRKVRGAFERAAPVLSPGASHALRASLDGGSLIVEIDGRAVWKGALGKDAEQMTGPAGLRSDNVEIEAELLVRGGGTTSGCDRARDQD